MQGVPLSHRRFRSVFCTVFLPSLLFAQSPQAPNLTSYSITARRISGNIDLRGNLSDPLWSMGDLVPFGFEIQPGENTTPRQRSVATILYNEEYLYIGFKCFDTDPKSIRANLSDRDNIYSDDYVIAALDTYGDYQRVYQFFVNPYGIQGDVLRTGNREDDSFDTVWESAASISDSGWTAEMAIPLKSIRFPNTRDQKWVVILGRNYPRESRFIYSWTPFDRNNPCFTCNGGRLVGVRDIESVTALDVLPYVVATQSGALADAEDPASLFEKGPLKGRFGVGARYAPNPDLNLDAVINPDFSQVETDASQISVNTTFALFFPEKRPFFLQGNDLFSSRIDAYYSRMINDPLAAAKLTAKTGQLSLAYLGAMDRNSPVIVPGEEGSDFISTESRSFSNIVRTRYDFGNENHLGGLLTVRNFSSAHNYVSGLDWNYLFWGNYYLRGQVLYSNTRELNDPDLFSSSRNFSTTKYTRSFDGQAFGGTAVDLEFEREARDYSFEVSVRDYSPTFQAQSGFVTGTNRRMVRVEQQYTFYNDNHPVVDRWFVFGETGLQFNYAGHRKERWVFLGTGATLKAQSFVFLGLLPLNQEQFSGVYFPNIERVFLEFGSNPINEFRFSFWGNIGKSIFRDDVPEMGTGHDLNLSMTIKPTSRLRMDLRYSRARLTSISTGRLLFDGYIMRANTSYQFTPRLFLRLITEYNHFSRSVNVYPLFSYKLNPFTIFYAGSTYDLRDFSDQRNLNFQQTGRQFFLKFQYLFRS